jgi:hypothetical protein
MDENISIGAEMLRNTMFCGIVMHHDLAKRH